ncbi:hypothetical protein BD309DRAFT_959533 [Dichomitus squalens]|nr:hypothetical protein BD309DRAFT_959533 [Dichomitus squalens]
MQVRKYHFFPTCADSRVSQVGARRSGGLLTFLPFFPLTSFCDHVANTSGRVQCLRLPWAILLTAAAFATVDHTILYALTYMQLYCQYPVHFME